MENKFSKELPEYVDNLLSNKISELNSKISQIEQASENNFKEVTDRIRENLKTLQKSFDDKTIDTENKIIKMKAIENSLSEKIKYIANEQFKEYVPLKVYKQFLTQLDEKMLANKIQFFLMILFKIFNYLNNILLFAYFLSIYYFPLKFYFIFITIYLCLSIPHFSI